MQKHIRFVFSFALQISFFALQIRFVFFSLGSENG